jgi:CBS domain-containing protein
MASNMLWCKSLTDWIKQYDSWMNTPGENSNNLSSIFFDYELVFVKIEDAISNVVFKTRIIILYSLTFRLKNSPLSFFLLLKRARSIKINSTLRHVL